MKKRFLALGIVAALGVNILGTSAVWAADKKFNGDEDKIKDFIKKLYANVLVLDSGARGATTSFVENG